MAHNMFFVKSKMAARPWPRYAIFGQCCHKTPGGSGVKGTELWWLVQKPQCLQHFGDKQTHTNTHTHTKYQQRWKEYRPIFQKSACNNGKRYQSNTPTNNTFLMLPTLCSEVQILMTPKIWTFPLKILKIQTWHIPYFCFTLDWNKFKKTQKIQSWNSYSYLQWNCSTHTFRRHCL